jgi:hypothetical protein
MSKFFRKVASAFVVMEDGPAAAPADGGENAGLEDIAKDTSSLLAQLEATGDSSGIPGGAVPAVTGASGSSLMEQTAEDVFRERGVKDTPSSALRVLKLIAGLSMFPREQQAAMIRAMDAADDSWSEAEVVKDAQQRQGVLRSHLSRLQQERAQRSQALAHDIELTKKNGAEVLAELDKRIAELYARREQEAGSTATSVAKLEQQQKELDAQETRARQGVAQVIQALASLLSFLGVPQGPENT